MNEYEYKIQKEDKEFFGIRTNGFRFKTIDTNKGKGLLLMRENGDESICPYNELKMQKSFGLLSEKTGEIESFKKDPKDLYEVLELLQQGVRDASSIMGTSKHLVTVLVKDEEHQPIEYIVVAF